MARARAGGPVYARAGAAALPFPDGCFDAVVACLVFEHIRDVDAAIAEVARVLEPGGRFCFFLNHPLLQTPNSGWIDDQILDPPEQYWRIGDYLIEDETIEEVEKDVFIPFIHRPLPSLLNALIDNGLSADPDGGAGAAGGFLARADEYEAAATIPRLLYLRTDEADPVGSTMADVLVISGLSGAGRTEAAGVLEDLGWYVVDNLPTSLVGEDRRAGERARLPIEQLALVAGRQHTDSSTS